MMHGPIHNKFVYDSHWRMFQSRRMELLHSEVGNTRYLQNVGSNYVAIYMASHTWKIWKVYEYRYEYIRCQL